jgi:FkbM family methyltransferase
MNLVQLASHTVDLDLLPPTPRVLDAGCRDFDFTRAIFDNRPGARIIALDPDPDIVFPTDLKIWDVAFFRYALVGDERTMSGYFRGSTGHGNFLSDLPRYYDMQRVNVPCTRLGDYVTSSSLMPYWDLVKLDIEGSEFEVLERWPGPIARQISCEFHDWNQRGRYGAGYYAQLFGELGKFGYRVVQHELSQQGTGVGHWDSLIVLDDAQQTSGG